MSYVRKAKRGNQTAAKCIVVVDQATYRLIATAAMAEERTLGTIVRRAIERVYGDHNAPQTDGA